MEYELPEWMEKGYSTLLNSFGTDEFRIEDAKKILVERNKDTEDKIPVLLSRLRKSGRLTVKSDENDARKKIYTLVPPEEVIEKILSIKKETLTRSDLESLMKKAADIIRTRVDYKFIIIPLFLKRASDKWQQETEEAYKEALGYGLTEEEARHEAKRSMYHDFDLPEKYLWENIRTDIDNLPEKFSLALKEIAEKNPDLRDVFENVDFIQFTQNRENAEILRQLVELFSAISMRYVSPDVLGDAYEWVLRYFAPQKAKEGEVYTSREVISLLTNILDPKPEESVYDPASASNGMLIIHHKHVTDHYGKEEAGKLFLFGQEANAQTLAYGKLNMYLHDIRNANLQLGDTLLYPKFKNEAGDGVKQFDIVVANPPWNQDGYEEERLKKGEFWKKRFKYGYTNRQSADWAWIQHMIASADDETGRVGVVLDNGCLFRGGKDWTIRKKIIEEDLLECVILLPEKLFYNTSSAGAILIFRKNKPAERKGRVLFINASDKFEKHPEVRKLNILSNENIKSIVEAYKEFGNIDGSSKVISLKEIADEDYSLNVTIYVFPEEETEHIDIEETWKNIRRTETEIRSLDEKIAGYLSELSINVDAEYENC